MTAVRISYDALVSDPASVHGAISAAFGSAPGALGAIFITDLPPSFPALRARLFALSRVLGDLPESQRDALARPHTSYAFGWSHGKEVMNGRPDTAKGSFYANPLLDVPDVSDAQRARYPEYYAGNVWPTGVAGLEEFEEAFKALGGFVADVGLALARACEEFAQLIADSKANKARLLHYYPSAASAHADSLCGTHLDHSLLTGLCSAMYLGADGTPVPPPSADAGLYIFPRGGGDAVQVRIPPDCLAFQMGEALELLTGGKLAATPHFVSGGSGADDVSRETFAFFLQPDVDDVIGPDGETFGQFTKRVLQRHYSDLAK
ncbi:hypothetical protein VHUM_03965 [Vanrija humicola]|uniref:Non-haem dioxygenase N-terminal domain-containing protein n=1 Tax=Vanrija humicola TaxID=5417 RepID=A0A7D8YZD4_VANHU|nr:hypothetical protein VHUM_03965 [Vanrija humicola]